MQIGLFGIIGIFGVLTAPFVGRLLDGLVLWVGTLISISILLVTQGILTGAAGIHIAALIIACFGEPSLPFRCSGFFCWSWRAYAEGGDQVKM